MSEQRAWHEWASAIDGAIASPDDAMAALAELASGLFPNGLPDLSRLTWGEGGLQGRAGGNTLSAEERLRAAEARFKMLVEQIPAVTFMAVLGEGLNEIYVSPHIEQMLGYTQEEWLSDPFLWYWRLHPDDRGIWNEEFARGCRTGGPFRADCRFLARDGSVVWVHGEARLLKDDLGRPMFLQGVAFDITEIKRAQEMLVNEAVRRAKIEEELEIAKRVQISLVPRAIVVPGLDITGAMVPAEEVGGDYYDVHPVADGAWIAVGDVAGHGLDAGLIMMMVQSATAAILKTKPNATPREVLSSLNEVLYDNVRRRLSGDAHVTFTLGRFRQEDGSFLFAGAHEDIIVVRSDGTHDLVRPPGTWLAARPDVRRVTVDAMIKLEPGDVVCLYTDGVTEARNEKRQQFELARVVEIVVRMRAEPLEAIRDRILADCAAWEPVQEDDRTLVIFRYRGPQNG